MNIRNILKDFEKYSPSEMLDVVSSRIKKKYRQEYKIASKNLCSMYANFYLCLERLLKEASLSRRYQRIYWKIRYHERLNEKERLFCKRHNEHCKYMLLDYDNLFLHTKIYFDGMAYMTKYFFNFKKNPSNKSFSAHRKFFLKEANIPYYDEEYACIVRNELSWWDIFIKFIRDKFITHKTMRHLRWVGYQGSGDNIGILFIPFGVEIKYNKEINLLIQKYKQELKLHSAKSKGLFQPLDLIVGKMNGRDRNLYEKIKANLISHSLNLEDYIQKIGDWFKFYNEHFINL